MMEDGAEDEWELKDEDGWCIDAGVCGFVRLDLVQLSSRCAGGWMNRLEDEN